MTSTCPPSKYSIIPQDGPDVPLPTRKWRVADPQKEQWYRQDLMRWIKEFTVFSNDYNLEGCGSIGRVAVSKLLAYTSTKAVYHPRTKGREGVEEGTLPSSDEVNALTEYVDQLMDPTLS